jgi:DNA-binding NtrC family response regulator
MACFVLHPAYRAARKHIVTVHTVVAASCMEARNLQDSASPGGDCAAASTRKASILVVDDEQNFAALLETVLTDRGYGVRTAFSADKALELVRNDAFDMALLDVRMGQASGLTLLSELKRQLPEIKVIMLTAYPTPDSYRQSFERGASAYCAKPLDLTNLLETIRKELL